jgi:hypothetical protein
LAAPDIPRWARDCADEDVIVLKLLDELDVAGYEIVKKPGNAGFTFDTPDGDDAA